MYKQRRLRQAGASNHLARDFAANMCRDNVRGIDIKQFFFTMRYMYKDTETNATQPFNIGQFQFPQDASWLIVEANDFFQVSFIRISIMTEMKLIYIVAGNLKIFHGVHLYV